MSVQVGDYVEYYNPDFTNAHLRGTVSALVAEDVATIEMDVKSAKLCGYSFPNLMSSYMTVIARGGILDLKPADHRSIRDLINE